MLKHKKVVACLLLMAYGVTLSGCWDKKEFNKISLVSAMAVDRIDNEYVLTAQIMMPKNLQEGGENSPIWILQGKGETMQSAVDDINKRSPRRVNFGQMNVVIMGEGALKEDVHRSVDFFVRGREFRRRNFFVAAEGKASDILKVAPQLAKLNTFYLRSIIEDQEYRVRHSAVTLNDLLIALSNDGKDLFMPKIQLVENDETAGGEKGSEEKPKGEEQDKQSESPKGDDQGNTLLELSGGALIGDNKLLGWQDSEWEKGFYWVAGRIKGGSIAVKNVMAEEDDLLVLDIIKSKGKISMVKEDPLTMRIDVSATLNMVEDTREEQIDIVKTTFKDQKRVEETFNEMVKKQVEDSIKKAQEMNVDVFGFGGHIAAYHKKIAAQIDWENYFQQMRFEVYVDGKLKPSAIVN